MTVLLNHIEVAKELFIVNDSVNYGRFYDRKTKDYQIQLTQYEIIELIEKDYCEVRNELKRDDQNYNDTSDFTKTNYCSLAQLFHHEADFEAIIKTYLDRTLFQKLFTASSKPTYVINSTDAITIKNDIIIFKGRAFEITT